MILLAPIELAEEYSSIVLSCTLHWQLYCIRVIIRVTNDTTVGTANTVMSTRIDGRHGLNVSESD
jgi:hypothetical protein